jgi:hypothetical protein
MWKDTRGTPTPLSWAVTYNLRRVVRYILKTPFDVDINSCGSTGLTPLAIAFQKSDVNGADILSRLMLAGADTSLVSTTLRFFFFLGMATSCQGID